uniref:U6 snRNA phosphodiesterase 1 n=1 Tax=Arabidopsis halleri TaxID=81970 RepID=K4FZN9_ARAHA|nr:hypothetical protein 11M19.24 [Arabidopsis halleri]
MWVLALTGTFMTTITFSVRRFKPHALGSKKRFRNQVKNKAKIDCQRKFQIRKRKQKQNQGERERERKAQISGGIDTETNQPMMEETPNSGNTMEALRASYGDSSSDSDTDDLSPAGSVTENSSEKSTARKQEKESISLPPPPLALLDSIVSTEPGVRVRNFPHVDGNYALHVYIPVSIPPLPKKEIVCFLKRVASVVPHLHLVEADVPLSILCKDDQKFERALGREFHISLGRSVPLRVHQINSVVSMLRQKLQFQKRYSIDFNKWQVFVNDDCTRSFLSLEITTSGLSEISKQIDAVNEVYKLHNLPEFYKV